MYMNAQNDYYRTSSKALYQYLVEEGFTEGLLYYTVPNSNRLQWWFPIDPELDKAIVKFYGQPPVDYTELRKCRTIVSPYVAEKLQERGFEVVREQADFTDWRRRVWLFHSSPELTDAIDDIVISGRRRGGNVPYKRIAYNGEAVWND